MIILFFLDLPVEMLKFVIFSSPEPKAHGALIVYRSIRRPSVR